MRITLVGSRHFGVTTFNMLRQHDIEIARVVCPSAPSYSLGGLCDFVGLNHPRPHRAVEDALRDLAEPG